MSVKLDKNEDEPELISLPKKPGRASSVLAFFLGLSVLILVCFFCFYQFVAKPMHHTAVAPAQRLADAMSDIFGAKVKVNGATVVLEQSEIEELSLVQRKTQAITKYETIWMGSKKILIVRCDFVVKAGFDLSEGGEWGLLEGRIDGELPRGAILSVEPLGDFEIYHSENGTFNKLSSEDHAEAFNLLKNQARKDAENSDIIEEAEKTLIRRINDKLGYERVPQERLL
ncbi:MAG: DUF4230 domain-containing protein [Akkermansiaceae bacterium]